MEQKREDELERRPVVMERLVRLGEAGRSFDLEFWERVGAEGRFEAVWAMVKDMHRLKGHDADPARLQRSVEGVVELRS
jgi:hypothetical protein